MVRPELHPQRMSDAPPQPPSRSRYDAVAWKKAHAKRPPAASPRPEDRHIEGKARPSRSRAGAS